MYLWNGLAFRNSSISNAWKKLTPERGQDQGASLEDGTDSKPKENTGKARAAGSLEDLEQKKEKKGKQL